MKEGETDFHALVFGKLSNTVMCLKSASGFDDTFPFDFFLVEYLLPTGPRKEAALEAYRGPGAACLPRHFPAGGTASPGG